MPAGEPNLSAAELIEYLTDLGGALLSYGCPTHQLERLLGEIAEIFGYGDSGSVILGVTCRRTCGEKLVEV